MKYLQTILVILTTIIVTTVLLVGGTVLYVTKKNPLNLQSCLMSGVFDVVTGEDSSNVDVVSSNSTKNDSLSPSLLSPEQAASLEKAGINPASLPSTISPELQDCFVGILGEAKVEEVKNGKTLNPFDILRSAVCLKKEKAY